MLFSPRLEGYSNGARLARQSIEPALGQGWSMQESEVVEMCEEPLDILFG